MRKKSKFYHLGLSFLIFQTACVSGPPAEKKSVLNHLNGEHYGATPDHNSTLLGVPITLRRTSKETTIEGTLLLKNKIGYTPLNFKKVILLDSKGKVLQTVTSQNGGTFNIKGIFENGKYRLKIEDDQYDGEMDFSVDRYELKNLRFITNEKKRR